MSSDVQYALFSWSLLLMTLRCAQQMCSWHTYNWREIWRDSSYQNRACHVWNSLRTVWKVMKPLQESSKSGEHWFKTSLNNHHKNDLWMEPLWGYPALYLKRMSETDVDLSRTYVDHIICLGKKDSGKNLNNLFNNFKALMMLKSQLYLQDLPFSKKTMVRYWKFNITTCRSSQSFQRTLSWKKSSVFLDFNRTQ